MFILTSKTFASCVIICAHVFNVFRSCLNIGRLIVYVHNYNDKIL